MTATADISVGARVYAVRNVNADTVFEYGAGIYLGEFPIPREMVTALIGREPSEEEWETIREGGGVLSPCIHLDNGAHVWGSECWWGLEEDRDTIIGGRTVEHVIPRVNIAPEGAAS